MPEGFLACWLMTISSPSVHSQFFVGEERVPRRLRSGEVADQNVKTVTAHLGGDNPRGGEPILPDLLLLSSLKFLGMFLVLLFRHLEPPRTVQLVKVHYL